MNETNNTSLARITNNPNTKPTIQPPMTLCWFARRGRVGAEQEEERVRAPRPSDDNRPSCNSDPADSVVMFVLGEKLCFMEFWRCGSLSSNDRSVHKLSTTDQKRPRSSTPSSPHAAPRVLPVGCSTSVIQKGPRFILGRFRTDSAVSLTTG